MECKMDKKILNIITIFVLLLTLVLVERKHILSHLI